jgi:photosystem II stability/assembly factor-like uncharacterized protein
MQIPYGLSPCRIVHGLGRFGRQTSLALLLSIAGGGLVVPLPGHAEEGVPTAPVTSVRTLPSSVAWPKSAIAPLAEQTAWVPRTTPTLLSRRQPTLSSGNPDWLWINPKPVGDDLGQAHFLNPREGWVVISEARGLLRTTTGGRLWERVDFGSTYGFTTIFFADPLHGWAAGNDSDLDGFDDRMSVIWATRDGGATWEEQYREPTGGIGAVVFANSAVGYAFGRTGLGLKTTDGGQTWQPLSMPAELAEDEIDLTSAKLLSPDLIWVAGFKPGSQVVPSKNRVLNSEDGGASWLVYEIQGRGDLDQLGVIEAIDADSAWVAGYGLAIHRTTDGGTVWHSYDIPQPTLSRVVNIDFGNPYEGWIALTDNRVMASVDGGRNWITRAILPESRPNSLHFVDPLNGWVFCDRGMIYNTADGGMTWRFASSTSGAVHNAIAAPTATDGWIVGDFGTILRTHHAGQHWARQVSNTSASLNDVHFIDPWRGWIVGDGGRLLTTRNGGRQWQSMVSGIGENLHQVVFSGPRNGWVISQNVQDQVWRTDDGGMSWQAVALPTNRYIPTAIELVDERHGWIALAKAFWDGEEEASAIILRTEDGGATWTPVTVQFEFEQEYGLVLSTDFVSPLEGWLAGGYTTLETLGVVARTTDGGLTWERQYNDVISLTPYYLVRFADALHGFVSGPFDAYMAVTRDGGATWERPRQPPTRA